ncbi:non-ribosomal peptide synthetase (plasmid) [Vibrio coralliilyticus]|uniref:non-ribosomal peptide synthetase n=1 Tax=Vibrio coralliilyticus TaxID=190893 RepID=UPI00051273C7|nr:non-ribosomal peptide synthetase [Vibrio coralliilyticus]AIS58334.1 hypothetical protein JV59_25270 [Vibrio coralliilyticus]
MTLSKRPCREVIDAYTSIHQAVFAQVERCPDAIAIKEREKSYTYKDLYDVSRAISSILEPRIVRSEYPIGVYLPRDVRLPATLLAIMASGGAYLPLDPHHPEERTAQILGVAKANVVVTLRAFTSQLPDGVEAIVIDDLFVSSYRIDPVPDQLTSQLAYFIFTSGSTGAPKGVMIEHANALTLFKWGVSQYTKSELAHVAAGTSITFDLSVFELFVPLLQGGCVHLLEDSLSIADWSFRDELTLINTVPSVAQELAVQNAFPESLAIANLAGEPLTMSLVDQIREQCSQIRIFNLYGPSEDTTYSTGGELLISDTSVTIGKALTGRKVEILDAEQRPVPQGEVGEIYVFGPGVARGYFQRPDLDHLFESSNTTLERRYRTGDFGKVLPDGRLVYLGRRDDQIKIRGHRIELGEVESVIRSLESVKDVAVLVEDSLQVGRQLKAAVSLTDGASIYEVMGGLVSRLPDYMMPNRWCVVETFPRLPNGKKNRTVLKKLGSTFMHRSGSEPKSRWERRLAELWQELLGLEKVFLEDRFVSLGGNSLLMARTCYLLRERYQIAVSLSESALQGTLQEAAVFLENQVQSFEKRRDLNELGDFPRQFQVSCSPSQIRFWTLEKLVPNSARYNIPLAYMISGELDTGRLENALSSLMKRHPILQAKFLETETGLVQTCSVNRCVLTIQSVERIDDKWSNAKAAAEQFARLPFDLESESPFRALLITNQHHKHLLILVTHHIVVDGSVSVLLKDFSRLYEQRNPDSDNVPVDYFSYCERREYAPSFDQLAYWKRLCMDFPSPLDLPKDITINPANLSEGRLICITVPTELSLSLRQFSQAREYTLFQVLLAISWTYLARVCQVDDLAVTVPIDTRTSDEFQNSVGNFVNTVILRGQFDDNWRFEDILDQAKERTIEAIQHSQLPYEKVLQQAACHRDEHGRPALNTMVSLVESTEDISLGATMCVPMTLDLQTARFDLGIFFKQHRHGLDLQLEYSTEAFSDKRARQIAEQWLTMAKALLNNPEVLWREAPLLSPAQQNEIIHGWNATSVCAPEQALIHDAFRVQACANPKQIAIKTSSLSITYQELQNRANQIAASLLATSLPAKSRVAVLMERSPDVIASILAIVTAGMVYVPFDPSNPAERFEKMVSVADIGGIVTDERHEAVGVHLKEKTSLQHHFVVGEQSMPMRNVPVENMPHSTVGSQDLAYVIFTSGTTGTPKAVAIQHNTAVNLIDWVNRSFNVNKHDVLLFVTSVAFDLSVYDIFGTLSAGGTIRLANVTECQDPSQLAKILTNEGITFWDSAPIAFEQCLPYIRDTAKSSLRLVFLSGDWIPVNVPERMSQAFPNASLIALGGATEATIWSNYHRVVPIDSTRNSIPYGKPIQNARYYILDNQLQPVPVGFSGDLYIAGDVLAQAYFGDPDRTAEKFMDDPFMPGTEARMYRTGDRARYFSDGTIEFLGREDSQVKIRGYRVEAGEIEAALLSIPEIQGAYVRVMGEKSARWLCAYLVYVVGASISEQALRQALRSCIPEYMVPAKFIVLDALPITSNGKLNVRALPDPDLNSNARKRDGCGSLEEQLTNLWQDLLQRPFIDRDENFFDLGGNSKLLIQMHQALSNEFGFTFPIVKLFQYTTLAMLQDYLLSQTGTENVIKSNASLIKKPRTNRLSTQRNLRNRTVKDT